VSSSFFLTSSLPVTDLDLPVFVSILLRFSVNSVASFLLSLSDNEPLSNFSLFLESRHDDDDEDVPVQKSQAAGLFSGGRWTRGCSSLLPRELGSVGRVAWLLAGHVVRLVRISSLLASNGSVLTNEVLLLKLGSVGSVPCPLIMLGVRPDCGLAWLLSPGTSRHTIVNLSGGNNGGSNELLPLELGSTGSVPWPLDMLGVRLDCGLAWLLSPGIFQHTGIDWSGGGGITG
jgi:hypothetical protein